MTLSEAAKQYIGQQERAGNMGFHDKEFDAAMRSAGFVNGSAWCMYFVRLCLKNAYPERWNELKKMFSPHCLTALRNAATAGLHVSNVPTVDSICIWQNGESASGHTGIVVSVTGQGFTTVEGNTNAAGSRNGDSVLLKSRKVTGRSPSSLWVRGFITVYEHR